MWKSSRSFPPRAANKFLTRYCSAIRQSRNRAVAEKDQWKRYQHGLAITEAKRWRRALDRADKRDAHEDGVPSMQMMQYLSRVDVQTSGKVRLGILTNGEKWRLYFQGALSISEDYFEIDFAKALELPGHELDLVERTEERLTTAHALRLFILMFRKQAFLPVDGPRTFHDLARDEGKSWEAKVTRDLSRLVFREIYPDLVAALHRHDPAKPAVIDSGYLESIRQSALILLYRLLFVVYAEDRDLLAGQPGALQGLFADDDARRYRRPHCQGAAVLADHGHLLAKAHRGVQGHC